MKKTILIFVVGIFICFPVFALEFSPTKLKFNIKQNEQACKYISINLDTEQTTINDFWAQSSAEEWSV